MIRIIFLLLVIPLAFSQKIVKCPLDQLQVTIKPNKSKKTLIYDYSNCLLNGSKSTSIEFTIQNKSSSSLIVDANYKGKDKKGNAARYIIEGNSTRQCHILLTRKQTDIDFKGISYFSDLRGFPGGYLKHWKATDLSKIKAVILDFLSTDSSAVNALVSIPKLTGDYVFNKNELNGKQGPLIDELGQYINTNWENKFGNKAVLKTSGIADQKTYSKVKFSKAFSEYGGSKNEIRFEGTGYFRTLKYNGKWWLVDPKGYLFWSYGVTGAGVGNFTSHKNRTFLYDNLNSIKVQYKNDTSRAINRKHAVNYYNINLNRKYGDNWLQIHENLTQGRLKSWGINTMGAWSKVNVNTTHPFTLIIHPRTEWIGKLDKLPDPFSNAFLEDLNKKLQRISEYNKSPYLLGVFINNEIHWSKKIGHELLALDQDIPCKKALYNFLKIKYKTIDLLNSSWGTNANNFNDLVFENRVYPNAKQFKEDMQSFFEFYVETYFATVSKAFDVFFPNHLYLGCRFHGAAKQNKVLHDIASKYSDVVSFNIYEYGVKGFNFKPKADKPMLIGEFHFGTTTNGVWGGGLKHAYSLENQSSLLEQYLSEAVQHSSIIGAHWFQWSDQPATGRLNDSENFRIGFVSVTDVPYQDLITVSKAFAKNMFKIRF